MKTLTLTPWPVNPVRSGGQERCWQLAQQTPDATIYSLDWTGTESKQRIGDVNYRVIPADGAAIDQARKLFNTGIQTYDPIPMLTRERLTTFRKAIDAYDPDLIILEHPWLVDLTDGRPYLYDSHNCETVNTQQQRPRALETQLIADLERRATQLAEHMTYTSEQDLKDMRRLYPFTTPITHIPNGVTIPEQRATGEELNLIFIGSLYGPNIEAAKTLITLAPLLPEYKIRIIGRVCNALEEHYDNVELLGEVNDKQLDYYLRTAHAFINLTSQGSGTHLKVGKALAYGLPVITTVTGSRGYTTPHITTSANVPDLLREIRKNWQHHSDNSYSEALTLTWDSVGETFRQVLNGL